MSFVLATLLLAPCAAGALGARRGGATAIVAGACTGLGAAAVTTTVVAAAGVFIPPFVAGALVLAAAAAWRSGRSLGPSRTGAPEPRGRGGRTAAAFVLVGLVSVGLRLPVMLFPMGGRDQGTYLLRARALARTGRIELEDRLLAAIGRRPAQGDADVLGLFALDRRPARRGRYEGAYRPGFYLADVERGRVVPQFLHGQPALLAAANLAFGRGREGVVVLAEGLLAAWAFFAVAARLLSFPVALSVALVYAAHPLVVWTFRQTLSEPLAAVFPAALAATGLTAHLPAAPLAWLCAAFAVTRADAWPVVALVTAAAALTPGRAGPRAATLLAACLAASIGLSAFTSYPYVHDEIARLFGVDASPGAIAAAAAAGAAASTTFAWVGADRRRRILGVLRRHGLRAAAALVLLGLALWAAGVGHGRAARLDPLPAALDPWGLALAVAALLALARRRDAPPAVAPLPLALLLAAALTFAGFAVRNLPRAHLYYYGRYLVPLLLPAALLLLGAAAERLAAAARARGLPRPAAALLGGTCLLVAAGPLRIHAAAPVTRLAEFEDVQAGLDALARTIPEDAVVLAGGEGWHGSHTFNQVGGALAIDHGRTVLPYRTDERAYAAALHLLVRRPRRTGRPPPAVFLLRNEATLPRTGDDGTMSVVLDDEVPAPLRVVRQWNVDLVYHRLSPAEGTLPRRVTRDGIRMVLLELTADRNEADDTPGRRCPTEREPIEVPPEPAAGATAVRVERGPKVPARATLVVSYDGGDTVRYETRGPRATDGPIPRPWEAAVRLALDGPPCPPGASVGVTLLGPMRRADTPPRTLLHRPRDDLGIPAPPVRVRPGRAFSPRRPVAAAPDRMGLSFRLSARRPVVFGPVLVPRGGACPLSVSATVRRRDVADGARLRVSLGRFVARLAVPPGGPSVLRTEPVPLPPPGPVARLAVALETPRPETDVVHLRDVVLVPACETGPDDGDAPPVDRARRAHLDAPRRTPPRPPGPAAAISSVPTAPRRRPPAPRRAGGLIHALRGVGSAPS